MGGGGGKVISSFLQMKLFALCSMLSNFSVQQPTQDILDTSAGAQGKTATLIAQLSFDQLLICLLSSLG